MATSSNLSSIIRYYAEKQNSPFIDFSEFCAFIKKYAETHVEEQAELVKYLGDPTNTVTAELAGLEEKHLAATIPNGNKKMIVAISYFTNKYLARYKEILTNDSIPYPLEAELPKHFPNHALERKNGEDYIISAIENQNLKSSHLFIFVFPRELPSLILPAAFPVKSLLETAQMKIRKVLKKDEYHDYFLKKLRGTNPAKEISIKNFFSKFVDQDYRGYMDVTDGDEYYLWNQLCYYLRQDFEKIQDRTIEDTNVLQAISISEIHSTYLKQKFQTNKKRQDALEELRNQLGKPPFFFSMNQILKFQDKNGKLLFGQYSEEDLKTFMQKITTDAEPNQLPELVVFKVASGTKYHIYKKNVVPVIVRLCNEAHESIKEELQRKWYQVLINYEKLPEMTNDAKFEKTLEAKIQENSPVLYSLLNASFLKLIALEQSSEGEFRLFVGGELLPYSNLLLLTREQLLADTKVQLPIIYTMPVISWIISFFKGRKKKKAKDKAEQENAQQNTKNPFEDENVISKSLSREEALAEKAIILSREIIPEGSTIDRELNYLVTQWNKMITKETRMNLTEDVNALIRDYTRRVCKTLTNVSLTKERIDNLAAALVKTPNMQKIGEPQALTEYVVLYMLRLVSNSAR